MSCLVRSRCVFLTVWQPACGLVLILMLAGCGGSKDKPVTAADSGLRPAGDSQAAEAPPPDNGRGKPAAGSGGDTAAATSPPAEGGAPSDLDPVPVQKDPFIREAEGKTDDNFERDPFTVPAGATPEQLLEYIRKLDSREPDGVTHDLRVLDMIKTMEARLEAADKILKSPNLDDNLRFSAIEAKFYSLRLLSEFGGPDEMSAMQKFATEMKNDANPQVVLLSRLASLAILLDEIERGKSKDAAPALAELKTLLADEKAPSEIVMLARPLCMAFQRIGAFDAAVEVLTSVGERFKSAADPQAARAAQDLLRQAPLVGLQPDLLAVLGGEEQASDRLLQKVDQILGEKNLPGALLDMLVFIEGQLEYSGHIEAARNLTAKVAAAFKSHEDTELAQNAAEMVAMTEKRLALIGQPFVLEGVTLAGEAFDWSKFRGKVVLVDFWASWCGICTEEVPNIRAAYTKFRDKGFEVVGVNVDDDRKLAERQTVSVSMPWPTVVPADEKLQGIATDPNAERCGVAALPFFVLVDKEGKVAALHVRGPALEMKLREMLGEPAGPAEAVPPLPNEPAVPPPDSPDLPAPEGTGPAASDQSKQPPAGEPSGNPAPPAETPTPDESRRTSYAPAWFCGFSDEPAAGAGPAPDADAAEEEPAPTGPTENLYAPDDGLSTLELMDYLLEMKEKPRVIQSRPGFTAGLVEAADRVLASDASDKFQDIAVLTKTEYLHKDACLGDEQADQQLLAFVETLKSGQREKVAAEVEFLLLERQAMQADRLEREDLRALLARLEGYLAGKQLSARHLRLASSTVAAINRLEDEDAREQYFARFGKCFSASGDKQLAAYGKKLAKQSETGSADVTGRQLELAGVTVDGTAFNWESYRGRPVLIQFWATWCPACLGEMKQVEAFHLEQGKQGCAVVGVNLDQDPAQLAEYLDKHDTPWVQLAGEACQETAKQYSVVALPTLLLVDREGKIVAVAHKVADLADKVAGLRDKADAP